MPLWIKVSAKDCLPPLGDDINDDGISHKVEGGLSLEIEHAVTSGGTHFIKTKIV